jgi:tetrahydromethanopterin S-methyltransferase subunit A
MLKVKVTHWPVEEGRYKIGNPQSTVAICTEATVEGINVDLGKVAIIGKCVTENIGIEKIVKNIVSNPNIRFLILCGKRSQGHDVGQTIISLHENGVDHKMKVIGSTGSIPLVKHLTLDEVSRFRNQIMPINLQGVTDSDKIKFKVEQCLKKDPGAFTGQTIKIKKIKQNKMAKCLKAKRDKEYIEDPAGSFQITVEQKEGLIILAHYNPKLELDVQITGSEAVAICDTLIKSRLIGKFSGSLAHLAYVSRELAKAEVCLKNKIEYRQDEPLVIKKEAGTGVGKKEDEFGW